MTAAASRVASHLPRRASDATGQTRLMSAVVDMVVFFMTAFGVILIANRTVFLPAKFFYDGNRIQAIAQGTGQTYGDANYGNVAQAYQLLGLGSNATTAGLVGFGAFATLVISVRLATRRAANDSIGIVVVYAATLFFGSVYLGFYSKDVFVIPLVAALLILPRGWWAEIVLLGLMVGYASMFRGYWYLIAALYLAARLSRIHRWKLIWIAVAFIVSIAILSLAVFVLLGQNPDQYRTHVNDVRSDPTQAGSAIQQYLGLPQPIGGIVNNILTGFFLLIPVPLAIHGGVYYAALTIVFAVIWGVTIWSIGRYTSGHVMRAVGRHRRTVAERAIAMLVAFVAVQALFEPDYGSSLRHATPILILGAVIATSVTGRRDPLSQRSRLEPEEPVYV